VISVVVADDQSLIRSAVTDLLGHAPGIAVAAEAADGAQAVDAARRLRPDVVLMDIRMPVMDGIEATRVICEDPDLADVRVLVLTTFEEDQYIVDALRAGASGFIGKGADHHEIVDAVRAVHRGDALLSPRATRSLIDRFLDTPAVTGGPHRFAADLAQLTTRELEVLTMVGQGLSNTDIADRLVISPHTVKTHVARIMAKLHAHDRAQLVIAAYENGLLSPRPTDPT